MTIVEVVEEVCYLTTTPKRKEFVNMGHYISLGKIRERSKKLKRIMKTIYFRSEKFLLKFVSDYEIEE